MIPLLTKWKSLPIYELTENQMFILEEIIELIGNENDVC